MSRFFNLDSPIMSGLSKMADLIYLNVLTLICCIPIVTIGAAFTSMHYVLLKMVRNEEGYITRLYFKSFKENFKQATILWLIILVIIAVLVGDYFIFNYSGIEFPAALQIAFFAVGILIAISLIYTFPVLARFENTIIGTLKNSLFISILSLPKTILMLICYAVPFVIFFTSVALMPLVFMFGISGPGYIAALLYNGTFKKFEPEAEEEKEDVWFIEPEEGMANEPQEENTEYKE